MYSLPPLPNLIKDLINPLEKWASNESLTKSDKEKFVGATLRVAAASACFALHSLSLSIPIAAIVGATLSLPTAAIAFGGCLLYEGTLLAISSLSTGSFASLGIGLLSIALGYDCLHYYRSHRIGIFEVSSSFADKKLSW